MIKLRQLWLKYNQLTIIRAVVTIRVQEESLLQLA